MKLCSQPWRCFSHTWHGVIGSLCSSDDQLTVCTTRAPLTVLAFSQYSFHVGTWFHSGIWFFTASAACAAGLVPPHRRSWACKSAMTSCGRPSMRPSSVSHAPSRLAFVGAFVVPMANSISVVASVYSVRRRTCVAPLAERNTASNN